MCLSHPSGGICNLEGHHLDSTGSKYQLDIFLHPEFVHKCIIDTHCWFSVMSHTLQHCCFFFKKNVWFSHPPYCACYPEICLLRLKCLSYFYSSILSALFLSSVFLSCLWSHFQSYIVTHILYCLVVNSAHSMTRTASVCVNVVSNWTYNRTCPILYDVRERERTLNIPNIVPSGTTERTQHCT